MALHNTIKNFYIKCLKPMFQIEVLGKDNKWNKVTSLNITEKQYLYHIKTKTNQLLCTEKHILIDENNNEVFAIDSIGKNVQTVNGLQKVLSVEKTDRFVHAYDLSLANDTDHLYLTDGFLSHNCVICDEFAFLQKNIANKLFTSMFPVISSSNNGKFIIVSTPNGVDNLYYDIWQKANSKDKTTSEGWKAFSMYWWQVPGHDEKWKAEQIAAMGEEKFAQEFNNEFLAGSRSNKLIPDDIITNYRQKIQEYKLEGIINGKKLHIESELGDKLHEFTMWHEFDSSHTYLASADVSEGVGGDASVLYVWDITNLQNIKQCAMFSSSKVSPVEFAYVTRKILKLYHDPYFAVESNGVGAGYIDSLRTTYGYENIVRESKDSGFGVRSHVQTKGKACLWLREMMTTKGLGWTIYDKDLVEEMTSFVKKDSKQHLVYNALSGAHDDRIMTLCWAAWILNPEIIENYYIVVKSFTSILGKTLPLIIEPLREYKNNYITDIKADPLYKQYLDWKEEIYNKLGKALDAEKQEDRNDIFTNQNYPYFDDDDGPSWNSNVHYTDQGLNYSSKPQYYVNVCGTQSYYTW